MGIFDFSKHDDLNPKTYSNYNEQIESAVQVFEQNLGRTPDEMIDLIARKVNDHKLAKELYRLIPIAYFMGFYPEVNYPDEYLVMNERGEYTTKQFAANALFLQVAAFTSNKFGSGPTEAQIMAVLDHSADYDALQQALLAGKEIEDLIIAPPVFM
ncbi:MAG: hypothetical protein U0T75_08955 [Chitinophagales bacterium]